jgi:predicted amidohydrolase
MKIAVYQFFPEFGEKEKNLQKIQNVLKNTEANLIVLPELCCTGYQFTSEEEVETLCESIPNGSTTETLIQTCRQKNLFIVAGMAEKEGTTRYNSAILIGPDGWIGTYRKVHLFSEEKNWFRPGNETFRVWDIGLAKIGIMICFDWIFPEAARSLALQDAEIICHPANLVLPFCQNVMITRSIENRIFTVTVNRVGSERRNSQKELKFTGGSQAVSPKGELLFRLSESEEQYREVEIDPSLARNKWVTPKNHLWEDRKPDRYTLDI